MMSLRASFILYLLVEVFAPGFSLSFIEDCDLVDLSYPFNRDTIYWPNATTFRRTVTAEGVTAKDFYYSAADFTAAEHGGTHLDAPIHFSANGQQAHQIPMTRFVGEGCVIDISSKTKHNPDYLLSVEDVAQWEATHGKLTDRSLVVVRTGWEKFYPDRASYLGTDTNQGSLLHFPGIGEDAAKLFVSRKVKAVGLDTASTDYGQSTHFKTHQVLAGSNTPGIENMMNLGKLPPRGSTIIALPMKIEGGSGVPVRIMAFGLNKKDPCHRFYNTGVSSSVGLPKCVPLLMLILVAVFYSDFYLLD